MKGVMAGLHLIDFAALAPSPLAKQVTGGDDGGFPGVVTFCDRKAQGLDLDDYAGVQRNFELGKRPSRGAGAAHLARYAHVNVTTD